MRILQVTGTYYPELKFGGPPQKIHALSCQLVKRGHQVQVATFNSERPYAKGLEQIDGVGVQYLPWIGKRTWQFPADLSTLLDAVSQADVVHCYGLYNLLCPIAALIAKRQKRPYLLEPLGMYVPRARKMRLKSIYHRLFTGWMARGATKLIATSPAEAKELSSLVDNDHLVLRRNGIDLALFQRLPSGSDFRSAYNIGDKRIILYIGRISPIKNLEQLITAFHRAALKNTVLVLVGPMLEADYAAEVRARIADLNLGDNVRLVGPLYNHQKLAALAAADLFVLPSLYESYGNVAAEAVAAGVPVLLTEVCGIAPLIHGRAGLSVPLQTDALADGLHMMIDDSEQRAAWTGKRADVLAELSWEKPLEQLELLYRSVTEDPSLHSHHTERNSDLALERKQL